MFGVEEEKTSMMGDEDMVGGAKGPSFNGLGWSSSNFRREGSRLMYSLTRFMLYESHHYRFN